MNALEARTIADHSQPTFEEVYFKIEKAAKQGAYWVRCYIKHRNTDKLILELKNKGFTVNNLVKSKDRPNQEIEDFWDYLTISWK